jgi:hypothetical protein
MINLLGDISIFDGSSFSSKDYSFLGPEDQLQEIVIIAYEAAIEAGLKPVQALAALETFAASERARLQDREDGQDQVLDGSIAQSTVSTRWVQCGSIARGNRRKQVTEDRIAQSGIGVDR